MEAEKSNLAYDIVQLPTGLTGIKVRSQSDGLGLKYSVLLYQVNISLYHSEFKL